MELLSTSALFRNKLYYSIQQKKTFTVLFIFFYLKHLKLVLSSLFALKSGGFIWTVNMLSSANVRSMLECLLVNITISFISSCYMPLLLLFL